MGDFWLPISKFSVVAEIPEATIRRYIKIFTQYFRIRKQKRLFLIHADDILLSKRIYALSCSGKDMAQIDVIISEEYKKTFDITANADITPVGNGSITNDAPATCENNFTKLILCMEKMIVNQDMIILEMQKQNQILMNMLLKSDVSPVEKRKMTRSEIVDEVRALVKKGYGKTKIAKILNENGVPTISKRGAWSTSAVARLKQADSSVGRLLKESGDVNEK